jgi:hypothetical protein
VHLLAEINDERQWGWTLGQGGRCKGAKFSGEKGSSEGLRQRQL